MTSVIIAQSGTGILHDDARGAYASETIYDDMKPEQIEALPATQLHHNLDLAIEEADKAGRGNSTSVYDSIHIILFSRLSAVIYRFSWHHLWCRLWSICRGRYSTPVLSSDSRSYSCCSRSRPARHGRQGISNMAPYISG